MTKQQAEAIMQEAKSMGIEATLLEWSSGFSVVVLYRRKIIVIDSNAQWQELKNARN